MTVMDKESAKAHVEYLNTTDKEELFGSQEEWTDDSMAISREATEALKPIFKKYGKLHKIREVNSVIQDAAYVLMLDELLGL